MNQTTRTQITKFPLKSIIMFGVMVGMFLLVYINPLRNYLGNIEGIKLWLLSLGWIGPVVWMGIVFILVSMGTPRLIFCPIGGVAFGFWQGLLWTQLPTLAGYYALFLFVRWGGRDFVLKRWPKLNKFEWLFQGRSSTLFAFIVRQIPASGFIINFLLGLSPTKHHHFILGSALGILPEAIPFTLIASETIKPNNKNMHLYIAISIGFLLFIYLTLGYLYRHSKLTVELKKKI